MFKDNIMAEVKTSVGKSRSHYPIFGIGNGRNSMLHNNELSFLISVTALIELLPFFLGTTNVEEAHSEE
jgi:hypothetical protein